MKQKTTLSLTILLLFTLLLTACGGGSSNEAQPIAISPSESVSEESAPIAVQPKAIQIPTPKSLPKVNQLNMRLLKKNITLRKKLLLKNIQRQKMQPASPCPQHH